MEKTTVTQAVSLQSMDNHVGGNSRSVGHEELHQNRLLGGTAAHGRPMVEQSNFEGIDPMVMTPMEQFLKDCIPWEVPHAGEEEEDEKEVAERSCYGLNTTPAPHHSDLLRVGRS